MLDGSGRYDVATGIGFLDHMLEQLCPPQPDRSDDLKTAGRPAHRRPPHDRGHRDRPGPGASPGRSATGAASAASARRCRRWTRRSPGWSIDASGRPYLVWKVAFSQPKLGDLDTELIGHWFHALAQNAGLTLHVETLYGDNNHHICEVLLQRAGARAAPGGRDRSA